MISLATFKSRERIFHWEVVLMTLLNSLNFKHRKFYWLQEILNYLGEMIATLLCNYFTDSFIYFTQHLEPVFQPKQNSTLSRHLTFKLYSLSTIRRTKKPGSGLNSLFLQNVRVYIYIYFILWSNLEMWLVKE